MKPRVVLLAVVLGCGGQDPDLAPHADLVVGTTSSTTIHHRIKTVAPVVPAVDARKPVVHARKPAPQTTPPKDVRGIELLRSIAANSLGAGAFDIDRTFVTIDLTRGKRAIDAFCGDDNEPRFAKLPATIAAKYSVRIGSALAQGIIDCRLDGDDGELCEVAPQDEHEPALTFQIARRDVPVLIGIAERETWMVDPGSRRFAKDLEARDTAFAKAKASDDCFKPASMRMRDQR